MNEYNPFSSYLHFLTECESWVWIPIALKHVPCQVTHESRMFRQGSLDRLGGCIPQIKRLFWALLKSSESCHAGAYPLSLFPPRAMGDETHVHENFNSGSPRENPGYAS
jgi:hypothetical protein